MVKWFNIVLLSSVCFTLIACGDPKARKALVKASLQDMVFVKGGTYQMGTTNPDFATEPVHKVMLSSFYINKYNTSYRKYDGYSKANDKALVDSKYKKDFFRSPNHPVNGLTWYQADDYCAYLAKVTSLPYALPTEAQWEYVARNRGKLHWNFPTDNGKQELGKNFPNFQQLTNQKGNYSGGPAALPVGSMPCTPMGVCGMTGAVNEWIKDWYQAYYQVSALVKNPQGPKTGKLKVIRGADADGSPEYAFVYGRTGIAPNRHWAGFRCVINSDKPMHELKAIAKKQLQG